MTHSMSKIARLKTYHRTCFSSVCAVLLATALLPLPAVADTGFDLELRRSDRLDIRRLGRVSEDERSVLRIEWRVALARGEEAETVRSVFDRLQLLEVGISAIGRRIMSMPNRTAEKAVAATPAEPPEKNGLDSGTRLLVANIAAASLVALWLFRRRKAAGTAMAGRGKSASPKPVAEPTETIAHSLIERQADPSADQAARTEPRVAKASASVNDSNGRPTELATANIKNVKMQPAANSEAVESSSQPADRQAEVRSETATPSVAPKTRTKSPAKPMEKADEPTLQLAEIMLSMGLDQGAAQALLEYIENNPRQAVYHWLKLLGIYRKKGMQQEFTETAGKLRQYFNIQADEWERPSSEEVRSLEKFTRVSVQIQQIWLQPDECLSYLRQLLEDNRDGARAGFPQSVAEEILFLIEILREQAV